MSQVKQITLKQAEKWLDRVKADHPATHKEMSKILKKYEKNDNEYECFLKLSHLMLQAPSLARDINVNL